MEIVGALIVPDTSTLRVGVPDAGLSMRLAVQSPFEFTEISVNTQFLECDSVEVAQMSLEELEL